MKHSANILMIIILTKTIYSQKLHHPKCDTYSYYLDWHNSIHRLRFLANNSHNHHRQMLQKCIAYQGIQIHQHCIL